MRYQGFPWSLSTYTVRVLLGAHTSMEKRISCERRARDIGSRVNSTLGVYRHMYMRLVPHRERRCVWLS